MSYLPKYIRLPPPGNFGCQTAGAWALGLLKMDWSTMTLDYVSLLLWPNALDSRFPLTPIQVLTIVLHQAICTCQSYLTPLCQGGKYVLNSAYDATIILHEVCLENA